MDFFKVGTKFSARSGITEIYPDFKMGKSKDLMVRGGAFYAIWDEEAGLWSTDKDRAVELIDRELWEYKDKIAGSVVKDMATYDTGMFEKFLRFCKAIDNRYHQLDQHLVWANSEVKRTDYASKRLPYPLEEGDHSAWDELIGTLYSVEERRKIEWAIGAVVSGDSKKIQKFLVLYGPAGTGKSTVLNIIQQLFEGYTASFEASALANANKDFSTEAFSSGPLVAIQHDGDLSRLNDNTKLNSIIAHEPMRMNEKYKSSYTAASNALMFLGTNSDVKISDKNSGLIRRLLDCEPSGVKFEPKHYEALMMRISMQLGAIAWHCRDTYWEMGKNFYKDYVPTKMLFRTNVFYNFVEANYDVFKAEEGISLKRAYALYKEYCDDANVSRVLPQYQVREELKGYFDEFFDRKMVDGVTVRGYYQGFKGGGLFRQPTKEEGVFSLVLDSTESNFDSDYSDLPAQYAKDDETPEKPWRSVKTKLVDIDSKKLHYVKVPEEHIVIDFDLKGPRGGKDLERNLEAASLWPPTYAELSKSGSGVHLHYIYDGDPSELNNVYSEGIEVKVYSGGASLRRKLTKCNNVPVNLMPVGGLPLKEKKMLPESTIMTEKGLRELVARNLRKEIHPGTKPSIDFIKHLLDEAHESGITYDLTDLRPSILAFANNSTNKANECLKTVLKMKFASENTDEEVTKQPKPEDDRIVFFDVEVYPNLFVVCWKYRGSDTIVHMINPTGEEISQLCELKLVGFNNRRYDNHILYGRILGYTNQELFELSQKIINQNRSGMMGKAYDLSYADIYDFSSKKQGLKKFGVDLNLHHMELDIPWDEDVPTELWDKVVEYCTNDVKLTEAVFEDRYQDFVARQILSELSGLPVNSTTQNHTAKIVFEGSKNPRDNFHYTDLSKEFPGYKFDMGKSTYRDEEVGEGGYVYAEPGIYENVALLDVASMHPTSIEQLNLFGKYTENFSALKAARLAIKHKQYDSAKKMLGGKLAPYLDDSDQADALSYALKIVINIVYGLTSAKFENAFNHPSNKDNIVAKRGALFMIDLKHAVQERGFTVAHIKTDSIKIPNATPEIIRFVTEFGANYGYEFEHEGTYDKFCLVNDAVYIAREGDKWTAVGAQFQHPYVFHTLFTHENIVQEDLVEVRSVQQGAMYLDFEYDRPMALAIPDEGMRFVGRTGRFVPVTENGAMLWRIKDGKHFAVTGTKGYLWVEAEMRRENPKKYPINMQYFERLADEAVSTISKFGNFDDFVN